MRTKPLSQAEQIAVFGNPFRHMMADGSVSQSWPDSILAWQPLPAKLPLAWDRTKLVARFKAHILIARFMADALAQIHRESAAAWATINDFGGVYNFRTIRRDHTKLSKHAWGTAIDLDVCDNPQGKDPVVHPLIVSTFEAHGFLWGGRFSGKARDGMHFEFVDVERLGG